MRILVAVAAVALCASGAQARERKNARNPSHIVKPKAGDPRAFVDDEPMGEHPVTPPARAAAPVADPDDGLFTHKPIQVEQPRVTPVGSIQDDSTIEQHGVRATAERPRESGAVSGAAAIDFIVERQMRKHQGELDACVAAAARRHPQAVGTLELSILVGDKKVTHADVEDDTVKDPELAQCLVKAAESWSFPLAHAHFTHPVAISPSAAR